MSIPESFHELLSQPNVAVLTTLSPSGAPQSTALWYLFEDGVIKISLNEARQKFKNIQRDGRVSFLLVDPANPFRTLEVRGTATIADDPDYAFRDRTGTKYGADVSSFDAPGTKRYVVTIAASKVLAFGE